MKHLDQIAKQPTRAIFALLLGVFLLNVLFSIHGFSLMCWRSVLGSNNHEEALLGSRPKGIRSDDWALDLPLAIAQTQHEPKLPVINKNVGSGLNTLIPLRIPVMHPTLIYRPSLWGFILGAERGISWLWWFNVFGVFFSTYLVSSLLSRGNWQVSVLTAGLVTYSPFFQFWSFHKAEIAIFANLLLYSACSVLMAKTTFSVLLRAAFFSWSLGGYIFSFIYPPFQVTVGTLAFLLFLALTFSRFKEWGIQTQIRLKIFAFLFGIILLLIPSLLFWKDAKDAIFAISDTVYPGRRSSNGGGIPLGVIFSNYLFPGRWVTNWTYLGNLCESAYSLFLFPLLFPFVLKNKNLRRSSVVWILYGFLAFSIFFAVVGIPHWLSKLLLWSNSTSNRISMGIVLADGYLFCFFLANNKFKKSWFNVGLLVLLATYLYTLSFNPLVKGGVDYILNNPLSKKVRELHDSKPGSWIVFGDLAIQELPRMLGVPSVGGYHLQPDLALWKIFDKESEQKNKWNQVAFLVLTPNDRNQVDVQTQFAGVIEVRLSPDSPIINELNVNHILADNRYITEIANTQKYKQVYADQKWVVFEKKLED